MCGLAGFWLRREPGFDPDAVLREMRGSIRRRGPDAQDHDYLPEHRLGLAHSRLAILDLSPAGAQPMASPDGRLRLVYNGEVYNYLDIRRELDEAGATPDGGWRGHSDTEVLLAAFGTWGVEATLRRCVGMFALALWDARDQSLTLARDRLGIKPLYYGRTKEGFTFGSQLAPLLALPGFERNVDPDSLALLLRHLCIPAPRSIFRSAAKLPPGCLLRLDHDDLARHDLPQPRAWWRAEEMAARGLAEPLPEGEAAARVEDELRRAVRLRLISDVPLGAFLSGGVDSSLVAAVMAGEASGPIRTFTIGFDEAGFDEAAHARQVADALGAEHTELRLSPQDALDVVPDLPDFYDEPFADSSQIPTYLVSRLAREHVTVCLSGDGGDELFGGYVRHLRAPGLWRRLAPWPAPLRRQAARLLRGGGERVLAGLLGGVLRETDVRLKLQKAVEALAAPDREALYRSLTSSWQDPLLAVPGAMDQPPVYRPLDRAGFDAWMMLQDLCGYLPDDVLTKVDRASMAVGLEARVPLLDHRVAETAWRLPPPSGPPGRGANGCCATCWAACCLGWISTGPSKASPFPWRNGCGALCAPGARICWPNPPSSGAAFSMPPPCVGSGANTFPDTATTATASGPCSCSRLGRTATWTDNGLAGGRLVRPLQMGRPWTSSTSIPR
nr:asparagine synthase (glutamine-hydrolyzing) [Desulfohalovibrio reitneri]